MRTGLVSSSNILTITGIWLPGTARRGSVHLPGGLDKKYANACKEWLWQYVFPATTLSVDPRTEVVWRHHIGEQSIQLAVKKVGLANQNKRAFRFTESSSYFKNLARGSSPPMFRGSLNGILGNAYFFFFFPPFPRRTIFALATSPALSMK